MEMIPYPLSYSFILSDPDREIDSKSHKPDSGTSTEMNKNLLNVFFVEFNTDCLSLYCVPGNVPDVSVNKQMKSPTLWNVFLEGKGTQ